MADVSFNSLAGVPVYAPSQPLTFGGDVPRTPSATNTRLSFPGVEGAQLLAAPTDQRLRRPEFTNDVLLAIDTLHEFAARREEFEATYYSPGITNPGISRSDELVAEASATLNAAILAANPELPAGELEDARASLLADQTSGVRAPSQRALEDAQATLAELEENAGIVTTGLFAGMRGVSEAERNEAEAIVAQARVAQEEALQSTTWRDAPAGEAVQPQLDPAGFAAPTIDNALGSDIDLLTTARNDPDTLAMQYGVYADSMVEAAAARVTEAVAAANADLPAGALPAAVDQLVTLEGAPRQAPAERDVAWAEGLNESRRFGIEVSPEDQLEANAILAQRDQAAADAALVEHVATQTEQQTRSQAAYAEYYESRAAAPTLAVNRDVPRNQALVDAERTLYTRSIDPSMVSSADMAAAVGVIRDSLAAANPELSDAEISTLTRERMAELRTDAATGAPQPAGIDTALNGAPSTHTLQRGDTLQGVADQYGTTVEALLEANPALALSGGNLLNVDQALRIPESAFGPAPTERYIVQTNDNLTRIARSMGTTVDELVAANPELAANPNEIEVGQELRAPEAARDRVARDGYTVQSGDTLTRIASAYGMTVEDLTAANPDLANPHAIRRGDTIRIVPSGDAAPESGAVTESLRPQVRPDSVTERAAAADKDDPASTTAATKAESGATTAINADESRADAPGSEDSAAVADAAAGAASIKPPADDPGTTGPR
jgi:LysM repeat protein